MTLIFNFTLYDFHVLKRLLHFLLQRVNFTLNMQFFGIKLFILNEKNLTIKHLLPVRFVLHVFTPVTNITQLLVL